MGRTVDVTTGEIIEPLDDYARFEAEQAAAEAARMAAEEAAAQANAEATEHEAEPEAAQIDMAVIPVNPGQDRRVTVTLQAIMDTLEEVRTLNVTTQAEDERATAILAVLSGLKKAAEEKQKEYLAPVKEAEATIKGKFALLVKPVEVGIADLKKRILDYRQEQERIRQEQEAEAARIEAENHQAIQDAIKTGQRTAVVEDVPAPTVETYTTLRTDYGTSTVAKRWAWKFKAGLSHADIVKALPAEYLMPDTVKIGATVRGKNKNHCNEADFGGVLEIYEEAGITSRGVR